MQKANLAVGRHPNGCRLLPVKKPRWNSSRRRTWKPTNMYLQARALFQPFGVTVKTGEENLPKADNFCTLLLRGTLASCSRYCLLSEVQATPSWAENQSPENKRRNRRRHCNAWSRSPRSGEVHLALARHYYEPLELRYFSSARRAAPCLEKNGGSTGDRRTGSRPARPTFLPWPHGSRMISWPV